MPARATSMRLADDNISRFESGDPISAAGCEAAPYYAKTPTPILAPACVSMLAATLAAAVIGRVLVI